MNAGTLVAPAMTRVATLRQATDHDIPTRDTPALVREGRERLLRMLAGPASPAPLHRPPHRANTIGRLVRRSG
jgi:hypothetical protein